MTKSSLREKYCYLLDRLAQRAGGYLPDKVFVRSGR